MIGPFFRILYAKSYNFYCCWNPRALFGQSCYGIFFGVGISFCGVNKNLKHLDRIGAYLLKIAIILLGLVFNVNQVSRIASESFLLVLGLVTITSLLGFVLYFVFNVSKRFSILSTAGTAICGATAVYSVSPLINAKSNEVGSVLSIIFILNAFAMIFYPMIGDALNLTQEQFGVWVGLSVHDTSSVAAISTLYGEETTEVALITKLVRTLFLIPLIITLGILFKRKFQRSQFPLFIALFILALIIAGVSDLSDSVILSASLLFNILIVLAVYLIGSQVNFRTLLEFTKHSMMHTISIWMSISVISLFLVLNFV